MPYQQTHRLPSRAAFDRIVRDERRAALEDAGRYVQAKAAQYPPKPDSSSYVRTGTLGRSITAGEVVEEPGRAYIEVGTNLHYAPYVEYGTGIYGPERRPITPKQAKFLAWKDASGQWIRARSVRGMQPWHFMEQAFKSPESIAYLKARMEQMLARVQSRLEAES